MKILTITFVMALAMVSGNSAEAQVGRIINQTVGTWHAPQQAVERGFPSRITINRVSNAVVSGESIGNRSCKWKSEMRTINRLAYTETTRAAVINCPNMQEIVLTPASWDDFVQDEVRVRFRDGPEYRYSSAKFLEERRRARESPLQKWGQ